mmetsp:Transcript_40499/g.94557  ORF Transcript_40499/g.94557 Transcript_40499/m.94557 type:complete len:91 (-) Transcript_40499:557-829(-)
MCGCVAFVWARACCSRAQAALKKKGGPFLSVPGAAKKGKLNQRNPRALLLVGLLFGVAAAAARRAAAAGGFSLGLGPSLGSLRPQSLGAV